MSRMFTSCNLSPISTASITVEASRTDEMGTPDEVTLSLKGRTTAHRNEPAGKDRDSVRAFLKIRFSKGNDCFKLSRALSSNQNIVGSWAVTGDWDMLALIEASSLERISEIREIIVGTGGIDEIETDAVLNQLGGSALGDMPLR